jgi:hypothetical protein
MIRGMLPSLKSANKLFVYYNTSRELYMVDLDAKTQTLQAGPTASAPSLQVPALSDNYHRFWAADFSQKGYCYLFCPGFTSDGALPANVLVFIDSDRDGQIDSSLLVSPSAWDTDGWGDKANVISPPF